MKNLLLVPLLLLSLYVAGCKTDEFAPSHLGVDEGLSILEKHYAHEKFEHMTTGEFVKLTKTIPVLVNSTEFKWMMKGGAVWTKVVMHSQHEDPWIIGFKGQKEKSPSQDAAP